MGHLGIDVNKLMQETFELTAKLKEKKSLDESILDDKVIIPKSAGVIYTIDNGANTFCIRAVSTESIVKDYEKLLKGNKTLCKNLKIDKSELDSREIFYFEVDDIRYAHAIKLQLGNRRFPHQEDLLCNISDPGFSWWLEKGEGVFKVHFSLRDLRETKNIFQLGPLGDPKKLKLIFEKAFPILEKTIKPSEFACTEKNFTLATEDKTNLLFKVMQNIFLTGENKTKKENFPDLEYADELFYYLKEISTLRKFWLEVSEHNDKTITVH